VSYIHIPLESARRGKKGGPSWNRGGKWSRERAGLEGARAFGGVRSQGGGGGREATRGGGLRGGEILGTQV